MFLQHFQHQIPYWDTTDCPLGPDVRPRVDGRSVRHVAGPLNTSEHSKVLQVRHIRAPKHYSKPNGVWVVPKSLLETVPQDS